MHTASQELSLELYKLSGWKGIDVYGGRTWLEEIKGYLPYYDLGYLLRKLPEYHGEHPVLGRVITGKRWSISYGGLADDWFTNRVADIPEDAACLLAIELFKRGVLIRG